LLTVAVTAAASLLSAQQPDFKAGVTRAAALRSQREHPDCTAATRGCVRGLYGTLRAQDRVAVAHFFSDVDLLANWHAPTSGPPAAVLP
jgi:hypothetical protein